MHLIVGLGNPGKQYEKTRHNVGFMVLDALHERLRDVSDISHWELSKKFNAQIAGCMYNGTKVLLAKPMTFMNRSGESVQLIGHYYKVIPEEILVVHDDKDIQLGDVKYQENRGHGGHNGIRSIIECIGTKHFRRVRVGIARENQKRMQDTPSFVLGKFGLIEKKKLKKVIEQSVDDIITHLS